MKKWKLQQEITSMNDLLDFYTEECDALDEVKMEQAHLLSRQEQEISDLQKNNSIQGKAYSILSKAYLEGQGQIRALRQTITELMKSRSQPEEQPDPGVEFRSKVDPTPEPTEVKVKIPNKPLLQPAPDVAMWGKTWAPAP